MIATKTGDNGRVSSARPAPGVTSGVGAVHDDGGRQTSTIERTLALVGDRWTILVIRAAFRGIRRFDEFCGDLGIARPILTARLRRLVDAGLMTKEPYQDRPPRYEYRLTPAGVALSPTLVALVRWGDQHLAGGEAVTTLVHAPCGTELVQEFWCETCNTTFGPGAIRSVRP
ncbi:MAG: putative HxlR family transcriptional regulator [Ilumatobacteraceae bacterium]|nr:putative HxlR family transcriptional regulator [Ilumatobacteraceae bacterium]MCU1389183.1 putative HxlR family transcriptional regulator [Ilumatobacteraceae bacterium]